MKNLKIYLPVLGLIALGGSSTSFLSLDSSSRLFDSLISKGSVNNLFVNIFGSRKNQQIRVKVENVQKTDVNSVGSLETTETVNVNKEDLSLPLNEMEEERQEESIESVQGIFTEIKREEEADSIKGEYEKNLKTSKEKLTESSQDFKDATISLVRFSSESPTLKEIKKKKNIETNTSERFSLDKQKRKALKSFYSEYTDLGDKREELGNKLKKVQNISSESQRSRRRREVSVVLDSKNKKVLKALEQIKWDEEINWDSLHKNWSSKNWNEENLFYPLLESEMIWKEWLKTVEEAQKEHDEYVNNGWRRFCGLLMIGSCYTEQESLKQKIKNAKKSLELRIGESLMKGMKRVISNFH